jgi:hypothetical protein
MSFSNNDLDYQRWREFNYFTSGKADGFATLSIAPGVPWYATQYRLHFSSIFASVEDLIVYVSSAGGSSYNHKILSQALLSVETFIFDFENTRIRLSASDQLVVQASMVSNVNGWGLEILGWAAHG